MTPSILLSLIALGVSLLCLLMLIKIFKLHKSRQQSVLSLEESVAELAQNYRSITEELHEIRSGNYGVANRVKELDRQVESLHAAQQSLAEQEPQNKFYNKGIKLISQGATVEEVVRECDMPLAEAELLFNLHHSQR